MKFVVVAFIIKTLFFLPSLKPKTPKYRKFVYRIQYENNFKYSFAPRNRQTGVQKQ